MYRKNLKDEFYTRQAKKEGYPARSVYKLKEIDEKYKIIRKGDRVLDLGSAPGSWLLYISEKVGDKGKVVGIDLEEIKIPLKNNTIFVKKNILDRTSCDTKELKEKYRVVVSDLAPKTTGIKSADVGRSLELSETVLELAQRVLSPGGNFVCKIFEGESVDEFLKKLSKFFEFTKKFRPKAVIKKSKEFYVIAKGFKK